MLMPSLSALRLFRFACLLSLGAGLVAVPGSGRFAVAHGDAAWIEQNPVTRHCCGPNDCRADHEGLFQLMPDGAWRHRPSGRIYRRGQPDVFDSRDQQVWWCRAWGAKQPHCVFLPRETG